MSVRDLTNEELLDDAEHPGRSGADAKAELRRRLQAGEGAERERSAAQMEVVDLIRQRDDARSDAVIARAEIARLAEQVENPWTDAVLVEKVARGLYEEATRYVRVWGAPEWADLDEDYSHHWSNEARRVLGEPS